VTRKQMADQIKFWLGLQDITSYDETNATLDKLYEGTIDMLTRTRCVARCVKLNVAAGEDTYRLDKSILSLVDIGNGARNRTRRDETSRNYYGTVVYPAGTVPVDSFSPEFTLIRSDILRLSPTPSENGFAQVWAVLKPSKMDEDTDSPSDETYGAIPEEWHDAIVTYALWKLSDYTDDASGQQGERYRMLYEGQDGRGGRLAQIRVAVNKRGTARAPGRRVRLRGAASRDSWIG
jgi:hypothetical protein